MLLRDKIILIWIAGSIVVSVLVFLVIIPAFSGTHPVTSDYKVGPARFHMYSLVLLAGIISGFFVAKKLSRYVNIEARHMENLVIFNVLAGLIGARLYHVVTAWDYYSRHLGEVFAIWRGGLGIFGGIAVGILTTFIYTRYQKIPFLKVIDVLSPALVVGLAIGRWGNFFNYEAYGPPTQLPWKMFVPPAYRVLGYEQAMYFHPTFLYESLWLVALSLILIRLFKARANTACYTFAVFLLLYFSGRIFLDELRLDIQILETSLNGYVSLFAIVAAGLTLFFVNKKKNLSSRKQVA